MKFDWDENKAKINLTEHQISFSEASEVFDDPWAIESFDAEHATFNELRFTSVGLVGNYLLRVTYAVTIDVDSAEVIRIISAREAKGKDKENYERLRKKYDRF